MSGSPAAAAATAPSGRKPQAAQAAQPVDDRAADPVANDAAPTTPNTPTEAINAWLAARRAAPCIDRQALAAWRQLLAVAEAEPELWQASTLSPWQKRFGVDAKAAALMMEWRGNWLDATGPAADWLADPTWLKLDAELQTAHDLAWAPLLPDEPAKAAEPQDPVPLNGKRRSEAAPAGAGARFGQALPTVLASPTPAPVAGDTAQAAWAALIALWQPQALPKVAESDAAAKGFSVASWNALAAPAKTPQAVIARLNQAANAALALPDVKQRLQDLGVEARGSTTEQQAALLNSEIQRWGAVIQRAGIPKQ